MSYGRRPQPASRREGHATQVIAAILGISVRTVEIHRAWVMTKTGARSVAQLVRMFVRLGLIEDGR